MELELDGKVAVVTGASRGIGAAIATELAKEGMHLCLAARDSERLAQVADTLRHIANTQVSIVSADPREVDASQQAIAQVVAQFGRLDLLVNNAGATKRADFFALTEEDWQDGFALKFHGYVRMARAAWPYLRESKGSIVNIVGIGSRAGSAEFTIGGSVNVALLNFTKAMADIGMGHAVRVDAINPGPIETDRFIRNLERVMGDRQVSREDAVRFLLSSHGTTRVAGRRKSARWRLTSPRPRRTSSRARSSMSTAAQYSGLYAWRCKASKCGCRRRRIASLYWRRCGDADRAWVESGCAARDADQLSGVEYLQL